MAERQDRFESSGGRVVEGSAETRPWLGVHFACAGAYQRVFRNRQGTAYVATCPKCGKSVKFAVGPGGSDDRFFKVSCQGA